MARGADSGALRSGSMLGRYELLSPIAQGGMAAVWAARQTGAHGFQKTVAVKTMLPSLGEDPEFERMFLAEGRTAMRVHHPNVVEILDLGEDRGVIYLVMEWLDGEPLSSVMRAFERNAGELVPLAQAVYVAARACRGLHAAHEVTDDEDRHLGLVHRDVSPHNVMVTFDGHVKVVDFGVAKSFGEGVPTQGGQLKGKIPYMAPEQVAGRPLDRRTDIFAMGTMLYRLTTGGLPFMVRGNEIATLRAIAEQTLTPLDRAFPGYPPALAAVIARCMAKEPDARYPSMAAVATALDHVLLGLGAMNLETELSALMKEKLGSVRMKRKLGLRDAAKSLGWATTTSGSNPRVAGLSSVGGASSAADAPPSSARTSSAGVSSGPAASRDAFDFSAPSSPGSGSLRSASGTASVAVLSQIPPRVGPKPRTWLIVAGLALAFASGGVLALSSSRETRLASSSGSPGQAARAPSAAVTGAATSDTPTIANGAPLSATAAVASAPVAASSASPPTRPGARSGGSTTGPPTASASATAAPSVTSMGTGPDLGF